MPPNPSKKAPRKDRDSYNPKAITNDSRFTAFQHDPRYAPPKKRQAKVKVDQRFKHMFDDPDFAQQAEVDKYGRKIDRKSGQRDIKKYYDLEEDEEEEEGRLELGVPTPGYDPARGEGLVSSSEEEFSESEDEDAVAEDAEIGKMQLQDANAVPMDGEVTKRLAAVNLDWDNVRAEDLMKTFNSFAPSGGKVVKVSILPSEFGKERLEREQMEGPPRELFFNKGGVSESDSEDEEVTEKNIVKEDAGEEFDPTKLRAYQLERLRYYYAVVECSTAATAKHIYDSCDGAEYEATANFFDLRFVPDDTEFEERPRDVCSEDPSDYQPNDFVTDALQHSKVKLTWDQDDQKRKQVSKRAFSQKEIEDNELKAYLASDNESDDEDNKDVAKEKYRALLGGMSFGGKKDADGDMVVTFTSALDGDKDSGNVLEDEEETTIEKYARKERERKQKRKERARVARGLPAVPEKEADNEEEAAAPTQAAVDLGFDDPFFADPETSQKAQRKEQRRQKKEAEAVLAAEQAKSRSELELLLADDDEGAVVGSKKPKHFDMKQILKAEKLKTAKGKGKGKKRKEAAADQGGLQDDFKINVNDPRFSKLFESHEYAIDPTNPRFVKSEATKMLMEERRKRTKQEGEPEGGGEERERKKRKKGEEDAGTLVKKLKKRAKMAG